MTVGLGLVYQCTFAAHNFDLQEHHARGGEGTTGIWVNEMSLSSTEIVMVLRALM